MENKVYIWKNKLLMKKIKEFIIVESAMIWNWIKNFYFVFISSQSKIRVFEGYGHWWLAKKYADKRFNISKINKYAGGKRQYVLPYGSVSLIVVNRLEITSLKARGIFNKSLNINSILKHAYYITNGNKN